MAITITVTWEKSSSSATKSPSAIAIPSATLSRFSRSQLWRGGGWVDAAGEGGGASGACPSAIDQPYHAGIATHAAPRSASAVAACRASASLSNRP